MPGILPDNDRRWQVDMYKYRLFVFRHVFCILAVEFFIRRKRQIFEGGEKRMRMRQ
jgi:hypothetical protein